MNSKEIMCTKFDTGENKTRLPRLSDSRNSASANAIPFFWNSDRFLLIKSEKKILKMVQNCGVDRFGCFERAWALAKVGKDNRSEREAK